MVISKQSFQMSSLSGKHFVGSPTKPGKAFCSCCFSEQEKNKSTISDTQAAVPQNLFSFPSQRTETKIALMEKGKMLT